LAVLKALQVNRNQMSYISEEALEGWIQYMEDALEGQDKSVARRVIQQLVAKIVIKEKRKRSITRFRSLMNFSLIMQIWT
jgi:hypothetical protein